MSTNTQAFAELILPPDVVAAVHAAASAIAAAQSLLVPVVVHVFGIFAAEQVATFAIAAEQSELVPPPITVHV